MEEQAWDWLANLQAVSLPRLKVDLNNPPENCM